MLNAQQAAILTPNKLCSSTKYGHELLVARHLDQHVQLSIEESDISNGNWELQTRIHQ